MMTITILSLEMCLNYSRADVCIYGINSEFSSDNNLQLLRRLAVLSDLLGTAN
jgi:hypothetical protein